MNPKFLNLTAIMSTLELFLIALPLVLIYYIHIQNKKIRALRYCLISMSDFSINSIKENLEDTKYAVNAAYITSSGDDTSLERTNKFIYNTSTQSPNEWDRLIEKHRKILINNSMKPLNKSDYDFLIS